MLGGIVLWAADSEAQRLFDKINARVAENLARLHRYTCVETVERSVFEPRLVGSSCANVIAAPGSRTSMRVLRSRDRLRLDVAVGDTGEMVSWAGASRFETRSVVELVDTGAIGSGAFASFLSNIFGSDPEEITYAGLRNTPGGTIALFDFRVPLATSHYYFRSTGNARVATAYRGSFGAEPESGDLRRLDVQTVDLRSGNACLVTDAVEFERFQLGQKNLVLPKTSSMDVLYADSSETLNQTTFGPCREFTGESSIHYGDAGDGEAHRALTVAGPGPQPLPAQTRLRIRFYPPVDSATAAAGDRFVGVVMYDVKDKDGTVIVHVGDKLHGRILLFEQELGARPGWTVRILPETIERNGIEQSVALRPLDDGLRTGPAFAVSPTLNNLSSQRPSGGAIFVFDQTGNLVLGPTFMSWWETQ
jgi:hypothetical protein